MRKKNDISELKKTLSDLLRAQKLAVLSSYGEGHPYANLVAFAATDDLKHVIFATTRSTRKFANISQESRVALLVDNRTNDEKDFSYAVAATVLGKAEEVSSSDRKEYLDIYIVKHPHLKEFVSSPSCALLVVSVDKYYVVSRFQNVQELHMS